MKKKKLGLILAILLSMNFFTGCSKVAFNSAYTASLKKQNDVLGFIKDTNYSGSDLSDIEFLKDDNNISQKFSIKNNIQIEIIFNVKEQTVTGNITAPTEANKEDIVNAINFLYDWDNRNDNNETLFKVLDQSLKSIGTKINVPINNDWLTEFYVETLGSDIYVYMFHEIE